ncbi:hypothetical protein CTAYLR_007791 [Chrysophaeum taylorii]|uniref:NIF system FeS cluster assembly NifU C-terminal domain-containing protein n=1 Tax=Chrysophaeum taylorii TaxID=2483200 RepID=A0AAD7UKE0_9STRA|nr:hypothetical protein CTAYLR_007791 [Chrysophaeum taylorii]
MWFRGLLIFAAAAEAFVLTTPPRGVPPHSALEQGEETRLEDRDVPEAHRGLHEMLYGSGDDTHAVVADQGEREDGRSHEIAAWLASSSRKVTGVYTVRDATGKVRYVGVSRDVATSLRSHVKRAGDAAQSVRIIEKTSMARREDLEAMREKVLAALDAFPDGNANPDLWAESVGDATRDDEAKRAAYDDSKQKLRAAMAETTTTVDGKLREATENDDWSAVIEAQTAQTIVSPFVSQRDLATVEAVEFTKSSVDRVLDSVRPFLVADGGNVAVVSVDPSDLSVVLRLEGACGSCPSSTTTMKEGLERALRQTWPNLGRVTRVEDLTRNLTAQKADELLDPIRNAISKLGAKATVLSANLLGPGVVELEYEGPETVRYGIELSLLDSPLVSEVRWYVEPQNA